MAETPHKRGHVGLILGILCVLVAVWALRGIFGWGSGSGDQSSSLKSGWASGQSSASKAKSSRLRESFEGGGLSEDVRISGCAFLASGKPAEAEIFVFSESSLFFWNAPHAPGREHSSLSRCSCPQALEELALELESDGLSVPPAAVGTSSADSGGCFDFMARVSFPYAVFARSLDGTHFASVRSIGSQRTGEGEDAVPSDDGARGTHDAAGEPLDLWLSPMRAIVGQVVDSGSHKPLASVEVAAVGVSHPFVSKTATDEAGRFEFPSMPFSAHRLVAIADGFSTASVLVPVSDMSALSASSEDGEAAESDGERASDLEKSGIVLEMKRPCSVFGRVLSEGGRGAAGAVVRVLAADRSLEETAAVSDDLAEQAADDDGRFSFTDLLPNGRVLIAARKGSSSSARTLALSEFCKGSQEGREQVTLTLHPTLSVSGRVLSDSPSREPIQGARVAAAALEGLPGAVTALTDDDGRYVLEGVFPGAVLSATAEGFGPRKAQIPPSGALDGAPLADGKRSLVQDFDLPPMLEVSGTVLPPPGEQGIPPDLLVGLLQGSEQHASRVDASGHFSFLVASSNAAELQVHHSAFGQAFEVVTPPAKDVVLTFKRAASITCRALSESGGPLSNASLIAAYGSPSVREEGRNAFLSDEPPAEDGRLTLAGLTPGLYDVTVRSPGFVSEHIRDVLIVDESQTKDLGDIRLSSGLTIRGHVVTHDGERVSGAEVTVHAGGNVSGSQLTDRDGNFRISGIPPNVTEDSSIFHSTDDGEIVLFASKGAAMSQMKRVAVGQGARSPEVASAAEEIELVLMRINRHRVTGRVVDEATGEPLSSFNVNGYAFAGASDGHFEVDVFPSETFPPEPPETSFYLSFDAPGFARDFQEHEFSSGETTDVGTIRLTRGVSLSGIVQNHAGEPEVGVSVWASLDWRSLDPELAAATTRSDGSFLLTGVPLEHREVIVAARSHDAGNPTGTSVKIPSGSRHVDGIVLKLNASGSIEGYVRDSNGHPIVGASVENAANESSRTVTGQDGHYRLDNISVSRVIPHVIACQALMPSGATSTKVQAVYVKSADEPVQLNFEVDTSEAGDAEVFCDLAEMRYAVLSPRDATQWLKKGNALESYTAPCRDGLARFEGIRAGLYTAEAKNAASGPPLGLTSAEISSGSVTRIHIPEITIDD